MSAYDDKLSRLIQESGILDPDISDSSGSDWVPDTRKKRSNRLKQGPDVRTGDDSDSSANEQVPDVPKIRNRSLSLCVEHGDGASIATEHVTEASTSSADLETGLANDQNSLILNCETGLFEQVTIQVSETEQRDMIVNSETGLLEENPTQLENETEVVATKKCRKRKSVPASWAKNKKKKINITKHEMKPLPDCRCKCKNKIRSCEAKYVHDKFVNLGSHTEQNIYLQGCLSEVTPKRYRPRKRSENEKVTNRRVFKYFVRIRNKTVEVCQKTFINIHGIKRERLQFKVQHPEKDIHDGRGKHTNHQTYNPETISKVHKFIDELPARESHYSRSANKHKKFLDSNLSIADIHRKYSEINPNNTISYEKFRQIFNNDFNISFGHPRKDICSTCTKNNIMIDAASYNKDTDEKKRLTIAQELHLRKAEVFLKKLSKTENVTDDTKLSICMDYQKNLPLPVTNISDEYYLRQLWLHNFGIHNLRNNTATMYLYTEQYALKGPNEVITALDDYISNNKTPKQTHLEIYCDNCYSQNKNRFLFTYLDQICLKGIFQSVSVNYPIPGHSMMAIDRDFALIERKRIKSDKIFTPDYYINLIINSKNRNKNEIVFIQKNLSSNIEGRTIKVKDYKSLYNEQIKPSVPGISLCRQIRFYKNNRAEMTDSMTSTKLKPFTLYRTGVSRMIRDQPVNCYNRPLKIKPEKAADVAKLLMYIPQELRYHYDDIFVDESESSSVTDDDNNIDEVE